MKTKVIKFLFSLSIIFCLCSSANAQTFQLFSCNSLISSGGTARVGQLRLYVSNMSASEITSSMNNTILSIRPENTTGSQDIALVIGSKRLVGADGVEYFFSFNQVLSNFKIRWQAGSRIRLPAATYNTITLPPCTGPLTLLSNTLLLTAGNCPIQVSASPSSNQDILVTVKVCQTGTANCNGENMYSNISFQNGNDRNFTTLSPSSGYITVNSSGNLCRGNYSVYIGQFNQRTYQGGGGSLVGQITVQ